MEIQSENLEQVKEEFKDLKGRAKAAKRVMRQSKADKAEKNSKFAATLSQLRRERGISQKKAAGDLGISQALLSHYEKGIRECGLDFVVKCADYYGVTTDYLLGVSASRNGLDPSVYASLGAEDDDMPLSTLSQATRILLDTAAAASRGGAARYIYDYYMLSLYRGALTMAKAGILPKEMFKLDYNLGRELASAALAVQDARFVFIEDKSRTGSDVPEKTALHTIIAEAEEYILNNFVIE